MRTQKRNRQKMYFCTPAGTSPIYKVDSDGNIVYLTADEGEILDSDGENIFIDDIEYLEYKVMIPVETGEYRNNYNEPVLLKGEISSQLENAIMRAWGSDNTNNYAVLTVAKNAYPEIKNGTRIWRKSSIQRWKDGTVDGSTADYMVSGILDEELNEDSYYLIKLDGGTSA